MAPYLASAKDTQHANGIVEQSLLHKPEQNNVLVLYSAPRHHYGSLLGLIVALAPGSAAAAPCLVPGAAPFPHGGRPRPLELAQPLESRVE